MSSMPYQADTMSLSMIRNSQIPALEKRRDEISAQISRYQNNLNSVCKEVRSITNENAQAPSTVSEKKSQTTGQFDPCETEREYWRNQIAEATKSQGLNQKEIARAKIVADHLQEVYSIEESNHSNNGFSAKVAYLFVSLWLGLLIAIAFSPIISLFAMVNHHVFVNEGDGESLYLMDKIRSANAINPNQPLLGIVLFFGLLFWQFSSVSTILKDLKNLLPGLPNIELSLGESFSDMPSLNEEQSSSVNSNAPIIADSTVAFIDTAAVPAPPVYEASDIDEPVEYTGSDFSYNSNIHTENGAPDSNYEVTVAYVVDENGNISDVNMLTNHGYGMEDEIIRAIKSTSGDWKPAKKAGISVSCKIVGSFKFPSE